MTPELAPNHAGDLAAGGSASDTLPSSPEDSAGMLDAVLDLPGQLADAWRRLTASGVGPGPPGAILFAGMGGSAISADLAAHLYGDRLRCPVLVLRQPELPGWLGPDHLLVASSFSGNTEETLAAYDAAGARGVPRVAITAGGALAARAGRDRVPLVRLTPGGQPRAAVGQGLAAALRVLAAAEALVDPEPELLRGIDAMATLAASPGAARPSIDGLALQLRGRLPIVYAPAAYSPVARRWKTQFNENGKTSSYWEEFPELDHNAVVGYENPLHLSETAAILSLEPPEAMERLRQRVTATLDLVREAGIPAISITPPQAGRVPEALWLVLYGDLLSVRLAHAIGTDPTPVEAISTLKRRLSDGDGGLPR